MAPFSGIWVYTEPEYDIHSTDRPLLPLRHHRRTRHLTPTSRILVILTCAVITTLVLRSPTSSYQSDTPSGDRVRGQPVYSRQPLSNPSGSFSPPDSSSWSVVVGHIYKALPLRVQNQGHRTPSSPNLSDNVFADAHLYREDGLMQVSFAVEKHPVLELIEDARKKWDDKQRRQSRTLKDAVKEYKKRYGRNPPRGFDDWWRYVVKHNVQLPDEYDQIHRDIQPFFGISPSDLQWLQHRASSQLGTFTISSRDRHADIALSSFLPHDKDWLEIRANERLEMLKLVENLLPDMNMTFTAHDPPHSFVSHQLKHSALQAAKDSTFIDIDFPVDHDRMDWAAACPPLSPLFQRVLTHSHPRILPSPTSSSTLKSFIHCHLHSMDPCTHPTHTQQIGILLAQIPEPLAYLSPTFGMSSSLLHSDIQTPTLEHWNLVGDGRDVLEWDDKPDDRALWRGRNTGLVALEGETNVYWRQSQRQRLVEMFQVPKDGSLMSANRTKTAKVLQPLTGPAAAKERVEGDGKIVKEVEMGVDKLNRDLFDVAFGDDPIQCDEETCRELDRDYTFTKPMGYEESYRYKYMIDVDGNGWSARFKRLMSSNSLILKSTIHPEWFSDRIQPWLHYVPVKVDFSDLYDIMTFFRGIETPNASKDQPRKGAHTNIARNIAKAGTEWSNTFWRKEDMAAYTLRVTLEYARVMSEDRESMGFMYDEAIHGMKNFPHF